MADKEITFWIGKDKKNPREIRIYLNFALPIRKIYG
jgi:hypothetical protein